jgi:hypothetical protein
MPLHQEGKLFSPFSEDKPILKSRQSDEEFNTLNKKANPGRCRGGFIVNG